MLGVNLGHIGFLAEAEVDDVEDVIDAIVERKWTPEDRLALDVRAFRDGELVTHTFALNEASVEKAARERMIEVVVEIDNRPLSRWGCDGVVLATPTGSTAYNFSAGGPIVWPGVEALLVVPISAHALFARPLVVAPDSLLAVEVIARTDGAGVLWCDGRRAVDLPPGARIEVRRADQPVRLARLHQAPFTDRLVAKFDLPGPGLARLGRAAPSRRGRRRLMLEEIRIGQLGVIESSRLELGPGLTVITGETGAGKTMVVTALGLLLGGRADSGMVRTGAGAARVEGVVDADGLDGFGAAVDEAGGEVEDGHVVLARNVSSEGRSRAWVGGASVPVSRLADVAEPLVAVHGQSDQHRLLRQRAQREALDRFGGEPVLALVAAYAALHARLEATERELDEVVASARERAREADLLRFGLGEIEAVDPRPGEDAQLAADEARLGYADALRTAAEQAREALSSEAGDPDALGAASAARTAARGRPRARPRGRGAGRPARRDHLPALRPGRRRRLLRRRRRRRPGPAGRGVRAARGADRADPQVRRDRRGGAGLVRDLRGPAARPRRHRRADRGAAGRAAVAARRARRGRRRPCPAPAREAAARLAEEVTAELALLAMPDARLEITVTQHDAEPPAGDPPPSGSPLRVGGRWLRHTASGVDEVEFLLAANTGSEPRPLHKGASGGELSRVMLALEVALAGTSPVPTFVFDEVDAGVGGTAAVEVGRRLAQLARTAQVLVVTHLPQVAAYADRHVLVEKASDGSVTSSGLTVLDDAGPREGAVPDAGRDGRVRHRAGPCPRAPGGGGPGPGAVLT